MCRVLFSGKNRFMLNIHSGRQKIVAVLRDNKNVCVCVKI